MDKFLCLIAELDEKTQAVLKMYEDIIKENGFIGTQTKDIPYHITLNNYASAQEEYLVDIVDKIDKRFKQIYIEYSGFGLFSLNVLYLNPAMNMELIELYNFVKGNSNSPNNVFAAHTTLFIDEPSNILKILPIFVKKSKKTAGNIKYISLYEFFPSRLIKRIELVEK